MSQAQVDNRNRCYQLLAIGKKQLGWDDEFYYGIWLPLQGATKDADGYYSATTMDIGQLYKAVERMKECGFKPTPKRKFTHDKPDWRAPRIAKLNAMWLALAEAGVVKDKSRAALETWCKRYHTKDRLQWASANELNACIEQLKAWTKRSNVELNH
jgi:hypothetical protein